MNHGTFFHFPNRFLLYGEIDLHLFSYSIGKAKLPGTLCGVRDSDPVPEKKFSKSSEKQKPRELYEVERQEAIRKGRCCRCRKNPLKKPPDSTEQTKNSSMF